MSFLKDFLNKRDITFQESPDGVLYTVETPGEDPKPAAGQYVQVHYTGKLLDGTTFDSSVERGTPFVFKLGQGQVIKGWDVGIPLFGIGGNGTIYLSPELGYGAQGAGDAIPPNASLQFDIQVLGILNEEEYQAYEKAQIEERQKALEAFMRQQMEIDLGIIKDHIQKSGKDFLVTESGLFYHISEEGSGAKAEAGKDVEVHYTGRLLDGTKFDSSHDRAQPIAFPLGAGRVIPGWDEGIQLFSEGGKGTLVIPSLMAYGPRAMGPIPANAVLEFDIEVVKVG
ncbi:FKBP-type peptidyl-prolyl cis-trans isomerase [Pontibacter sp. G13]|uniref:FKBP-type peptidyl-prolyl cis-trans isomerase n=1 Tax=Pontibacter sp. G13 TaxID=3074898 RepID=UPI0028890D2B|nr:FKBP-type peptidyl-prolyl cis-trans isomerase [Pontibacter sp. G13]WNJ20681.1 FKBP-type peptidyl-prolyl cis-trans isomerase [Pontibacter sp. G13]